MNDGSYALKERKGSWSHDLAPFTRLTFGAFGFPIKSGVRSNLGRPWAGARDPFHRKP